MESLEELKAIIDNAPDVATHVDEDGSYLRFNAKAESWHLHRKINDLWECADYDYIFYFSSIRSLADIKRIIELMEGK